ncbi:single-stranded DNA-binding protein (plasmid) [Streptomyces sp. GDS52]|uniref:single-stranded DNA-binding protein n=1 Tax=Streptomyces sp. GDS52 TaxID=3406419 RepID=UPI003FCF1C92
MSLPMLNGTARLIDTPELRFSAQGTAVVKVRLAFNARKKDDSGQWVDGDSFFIDGKLFGQHAQNIADSLEKGMEVVVSGRLKTERWETREGEKRSGPSLLVDSIGPSLRFATARVEKTGGSGQGRQRYEETRRQSSREGRQDPWASGVPGTSPASGTSDAGAWGEEPPF